MISADAPDNAARVVQEASAPDTHTHTRTPLPVSGVFDELANAFVSARAALSNFLDLLTLEARRAGLALVWMLGCAVVAVVCIVAAWMGLMAVLVMWAVALGFSPILAVAVAVAANAVVGAVLIYQCVGISRNLLFPATRRQLAGTLPNKLMPP
jgi:hypothetical protein